MSDTGFKDALYFGENLTDEFAKSSAISSLISFFNTYHLGPTPHVVCGCSKTDSSEPVIKGDFLTAEIMAARSKGFVHKPVESRKEAAPAAVPV